MVKLNYMSLATCKKKEETKKTTIFVICVIYIMDALFIIAVAIVSVK